MRNLFADLGAFSSGADEYELLTRIDRQIVDWATSLGAREERNPELLHRDQLESIGYFTAFPHLGHRVTPIQAEEAGEECFLTSAACYGAYFARAEQELDADLLVTVRQTCRRRESHYEPRRRQHEFQMREVVAIGSDAHVMELLAAGERFMRELAGELGVTGAFEVATDPFFKQDDPRAAFQRVFPTKREFVDSSDLSLGSLNRHQTFFGDACSISQPTGEPVATGCVAFGLERWVDAVLRSRTPAAAASAEVTR